MDSSLIKIIASSLEDPRSIHQDRFLSNISKYETDLCLLYREDPSCMSGYVIFLLFNLWVAKARIIREDLLALLGTAYFKQRFPQEFQLERLKDAAYRCRRQDLVGTSVGAVDWDLLACLRSSFARDLALIDEQSRKIYEVLFSACDSVELLLRTDTTIYPASLPPASGGLGVKFHQTYQRGAALDIFGFFAKTFDQHVALIPAHSPSKYWSYLAFPKDAAPLLIVSCDIHLPFHETFAVAVAGVA